jgi:hypothetical protein
VKYGAGTEANVERLGAGEDVAGGGGGRKSRAMTEKSHERGFL